MTTGTWHNLLVNAATQAIGSEALLGLLSCNVTALAKKVRLAMKRGELASKFQFYLAIL